MAESSNSSDSAYREQIMDHYRNPRNKGHLQEFSFKQVENNPLCGDELEIEVKLDGEIISDIKFSGKGCSISQASASMLTEFVKNKKINEVNELTREDIIEMLGIPIGPVRIKCAVLSLVALKNGIREFENTFSEGKNGQ